MESNTSLSKICSWCGKCNDSVNRNEFNGICRECRLRLLPDNNIAKIRNELIKDKLYNGSN